MQVMAKPSFMCSFRAENPFTSPGPHLQVMAKDALPCPSPFIRDCGGDSLTMSMISVITCRSKPIVRGISPFRNQDGVTSPGSAACLQLMKANVNVKHAPATTHFWIDQLTLFSTVYSAGAACRGNYSSPISCVSDFDNNSLNLPR